MKFKIFTLLLVILTVYANAQDNTTLITELNRTILQSSRYDAAKIKKIAALKNSLSRDHTTTAYDKFLTLYREYQIFNYDSAYTYARKMLASAIEMNDSGRKANASIKMSFILLSSGMFKEVFDSLKSIPLQQLDNTGKAEYYTLKARCFYDLADYDLDQFYSPGYNREGNRFIDSSLNLYPVNSFEYVYYNGLKNIRAGNKEKAFTYFQQLMNSTSLTPHEFALTSSTLSDIYIQNSRPDSAISLLIKAAISDIRSSTKETSATFNLATLLFRKGDLKNASTYIEKAVNDAIFYGARQRKVQLSTILPLIEAEKLNLVEKEKKLVTTYAVIVTFLMLLLLILSFIIIKQVIKLKKAKKIITDANVQLQFVNRKLMEANKIKEEYIGYFFSGNSEFYTRIERFKKSVEQKIFDRKLDEIRFLVNNLNLKKERDELLKNFDAIFLKLFPHFIDEF
ncbi:MAG TPA: DUF6377 domain-containing protein, partial [Ferruginibacter sp.]|nr:DUF6377 domain-containing protein [Ferruginibacter sp.]